MAFNAFVKPSWSIDEGVMRTYLLALALAASALLPSAGAARAADEITVTLKDHRFSPTEVKVPANKRVTIIVVNDDPTPEEFESHPLKVEKMIPGKSKALIRIGPLKPGRYEFVGEYHESTAKGVVIAE
jgi:hypothetical protein